MESSVSSNPAAPGPPGPAPGVETVVAAGPHRSLQVRIHDTLHQRATLGPAMVLLLSVLLFSITADNFLAAGNLSLIIQQVAVVGTLAVAQTLIILTAGIDLSVGAIMVLSSIAMAKLSADSGVPGGLAQAAQSLMGSAGHAVEPVETSAK